MLQSIISINIHLLDLYIMYVHNNVKINRRWCYELLDHS